MSTPIRTDIRTGRSTGQVIVQDHISLAYAASITLVNNPNVEQSTRVIGALTGALTLVADATNPLIGDTLVLVFNGGASAYTVTYGTNFTAGTSSDTIGISVTGVATFRYNGTTWDKLTSVNPAGSPATYQTKTVSAPAYASTLALTPAAGDNRYNVGALTGAMTINITTTNMLAGDIASFTFVADATGGRVVTFGTAMKSAGTLTPTASKFAGIQFQYDGTELIELGRAVTA